MNPMINPEYYTRLFIQRLEAYSSGESIERNNYTPWAERHIKPDDDWDGIDDYEGLNKDRLSERTTLLKMLANISQFDSAPFLLCRMEFPDVEHKDFFNAGVDLESYSLRLPWGESICLDAEAKTLEHWSFSGKKYHLTVRALTIDCPIFDGQPMKELILALETWLSTGMKKVEGENLDQRERKCISTQDALRRCGLKANQRQQMRNWIMKLDLEVCEMRGYEWLDVIDQVAARFNVVDEK